MNHGTRMHTNPLSLILSHGALYCSSLLQMGVDGLIADVLDLELMQSKNTLMLHSLILLEEICVVFS